MKSGVGTLAVALVSITVIEVGRPRLDHRHCRLAALVLIFSRNLAESLKTSTVLPEEEHILNTWRSFVIYALLLFVGINLRSVILAVPPVLPLIKHDLNLSYTATGLLTSMPILIMGATAWSSGLLIERIGGRNAVTWGLLMLAVG